MSKDILSRIVTRRLISPSRQTSSDAAVVSQILDRQGYEAVGIVIQTGNLTDSDATFACLLEESNDSGMSGANTVAAEDCIPAVAPATTLAFRFSDDHIFKSVGYVGAKRYLRLTITPTSNAGGNLDVSAFAILGSGSKQP